MYVQIVHHKGLLYDHYSMAASQKLSGMSDGGRETTELPEKFSDMTWL